MHQRPLAVPSSVLLWVYGGRLFVVSARTNKRHYHHVDSFFFIISFFTRLLALGAALHVDSFFFIISFFTRLLRLGAALHVDSLFFIIAFLFYTSPPPHSGSISVPRKLSKVTF